MTADRLTKIVTEILVDMEEDRLCPACLMDDCEEHDEFYQTPIGCSDGKELAKHLAAAGVTVATQPAEEDVSDALWAKWTGGERLAYSMGYRRGQAAQPAPDALREAAQAVVEWRDLWSDIGGDAALDSLSERIDVLAAALVGGVCHGA